MLSRKLGRFSGESLRRVALNRRLVNVNCAFRKERSANVLASARAKMSINGDVMSDVDICNNDESLTTDPTEVMIMVHDAFLTETGLRF